MSTATEEKPDTTEVTNILCPKCQVPIKHVVGTDVTHCDGCGQSWGTATPEAGDQPARPTEVISPSSEVVPAVDAVHTLAEFDRQTQIDMPLIPGMEEFRALAMQARIMAMSNIVPAALQNKPADVFVVLLTGRDLGIPITAAINQIHVIEGRASIAPKLLNARLRSLNLGSVRKLVATREHAIVCALEPGGRLDRRCVKAGGHLDDCKCIGLIGETEFTWQDAQDGGLVMPDCNPGDHTTKCLDYRSKSYDRCRQGYRTYPQRMMLWRATGWCADEFFPEASMGLYSPEELGAMVDDQGDPIDPTNITLPEGFEPPPPAVDALDEPANPKAVAHMRERIANLPEAQRNQLKARWQAKQDEGRLQNIKDLTERGYKIANALLNGQESIASKNREWKAVPPLAEWDDPIEGATEAGSEAPVGQEPPETPGGVDVATEADRGSEATTEAPAGPALAPALLAQVGLAVPLTTEEHVEQAISMVQGMTIKQLNGACRPREISTRGTDKESVANRQRQLAQAMANEFAENDWEEANSAEV